MPVYDRPEIVIKKAEECINFNNDELKNIVCEISENLPIKFFKELFGKENRYNRRFFEENGRYVYK